MGYSSQHPFTMTCGTSTDQTNDVFVQRCIEHDCGARYGLNERLYVCASCGGLLDIERTTAATLNPISLRAQWLDRRASSLESDRSGVWRFRELLPFSPNVECVTLNEGNTPLYEASQSAGYCHLDSLKLKHQGMNPTASFKDTGMTVAITQARILKSKLAICASTGNTAASLAAYAAKANMICAILVPAAQISPAKLAQALDYGANVIEVEGNFDACMQLMREVSVDDAVYLVNSINPFRIEGQKTVAVELMEQLDWQVPDHLVVPGGNLGNSSAFGKGFRDLLELKFIDRLPRITVVQAEGAAPFARFFSEQSSWDRTRPRAHATTVSEADLPTVGFVNQEEPHTLASAIKIGAPVSWQKAWRAVAESEGQVITVTEQEIADAKAIIGRDGIGCEPASATTVGGIKKLVASGFINSDESVVAVLTGHMLKDPDYIIGYHTQTLQASPTERIYGTFTNPPLRITSSAKSLKEVFEQLTDVR